MKQSSELMINADGSIYHLHLCPNELAKNVILVGDPARADMVASFFDHIDVEKSNREFHTVTGWYNNIKVTVLSTGIGTDNIDIVLNELDALVNIDLKTGEVKPDRTSLNLIRIGTSGSVDKLIPIGSYVVSQKSIGFDGLLNFYMRRNEVCDLNFEKSLMQHLNWNKMLADPYVVDCSKKLFDMVNDEKIVPGINISAPGFYGPQGRVLRLPLLDPMINEKIESFDFYGKKISNYEMESSAIYGLSKLLGHNALTVCLIIANRVTKEALTDYKPKMEEMISFVLDKLAKTA